MEPAAGTPPGFRGMEIIVSTELDPAVNLSAEERLLTERRHDVLFLYVNGPSVIVGRNQCPEAEADTGFCRAHGIPVLRRISGGGTVYHDPGNVNFSFLLNRGEVSVLDGDFLTPVVRALASFGLSVEVGSRRELLLEGRKISGTAAHVTRDRQLFHGTLLYDTDLAMLRRVLRGDASRRGRRVASVSSPVTNIADHLPERWTTGEFLRRLADFFREYYAM